MAKQSELETLFVTIIGKDDQLDATFKRVKERAAETAKAIRDSIAESFTGRLFDPTELNAAFAGVTEAARQAAAAVKTVSDANAEQVNAAKAAAADVGKAVSEAAQGTAQAASTAAEATGKLGDVGRAAQIVGRQVVEAADATTQGGKDFAAWAAELQRDIEKLGNGTANAADLVKTLMASMRGLGKESEVAAAQQKALNIFIADLSDQVRNVRSAYINGRMSQGEFIESSKHLKTTIGELQDGLELTTKQQLKLNIASATAERGLATLRGEASRLGLAHQVNLSLMQTFGTQLRSFGPAGVAASASLGFLSKGLSGLQAPLSAADFSLGKLGATLMRLPSLIGLASTAVTLGLGVALFKAAQGAAETADKIDKASQSAGFTAEAFQEVAYALEQSGVALDQTRQGLNDFNARLGQAAAGSRSIADAYKRLGVELRDTHGAVRDGEAVFTDLISSLSAVETAAEKAAIGGQVFGEEFSRRIIPALNTGVDGFNALRKEARDLGLILSGGTVQSLVAFKDEMNTVKRQVETAKIEIAAGFLPVLQQVLIPLLQNYLVPALQTAATKVQEFTQKFLDQTPAGVEFRAQMIKNFEPLLRFGDIIAGIAQGFVSFGQLVVGTAAGVGAALGTLSVQAERFAQKMSTVGEGLAWWQQGNVLGAIEIWKRTGKAVADAFDPNEIGRSFEDAAGRYLDAAFNNASAAQEHLVRALSGDYSGLVEGLVSDLAGAANAGASAFNNLADGATNATNAINNIEVAAPAGSLAELRQQLSAAQKEFEQAATDEARTAAIERIRIKEQEIAVITAMLSTADPFKDARTWTARLGAELEFGLKTAAEVFDIITPRMEELRQEAAAALKDFGFDSTEYTVATGKLRVLEELLQRVTRDKKTLTVDVKANVLAPVDLVTPEALATLTPVMQRFLELLGRPSEAAMADFRQSFTDWTRNVGLASNSAASSLNQSSEAVRIFADTIQAMRDSGAGLAEIMAALGSAGSPFASALMLPPGDLAEQQGLLQRAYAEQQAAFARVQAAMTEDQIVEESRRYAEAVANVKRLEALYGTVDLAPDIDIGKDIRQQLSVDIAASTRALVAFGREGEITAKSLSLVEGAIAKILANDPSADIADLTNWWSILNARLGDTVDSGEDATKALAELASAQAKLAQLAGTAPSQWDELRAAFEAAGEAGLLTSDQLKELLETIGKLEKVDQATKALNDLAGNIDLGSSIAQGLTNALAGVRDGDLQGALGGLTQLGAAIGTLIGGPAVGALVQAIGQGLQAVVGLFQVISDLFTGDSPARRKLAESLSSTVAGAFKTGIIEGLRGGEDWRENLRQNVQEAVLGAVVDAFIQAAVMQAIFAPFIDQFTKLLKNQGADAAFAFFDQQFGAFWESAMSVVEDFVERGRDYFKQAEQAANDVQELTPGRFDLPSATVSVLAAPQWSIEMGTVATTMREAGDAMLSAASMMQATFQQGIPVTTQSSRGIDAMRSF